MYSQAGYDSVRSFVSDAVRRHLADLERSSDDFDDNREEILQKARGIVPQTDNREHLHTGESFSADTELETHFVAMVIDTHGFQAQNRAARWTRTDFLLPPEDRDLSLRKWTALKFNAGQISRRDLERWDLPTKWIADLA